MIDLKYKLRDFIDIIIARLAIWSIKKGYGASCEEYVAGCGSCEAKKTVDWLEDHIRLIKL